MTKPLCLQCGRQLTAGSKSWYCLKCHFTNSDREQHQRSVIATADDLVEQFKANLTDPSVIPMSIEISLATSIAALLQLALRHPGVVRDTPSVAVTVKIFVDGLIESIVNRSGEDADLVAATFARGWDEDSDVTKQEFELLHGETEPYLDERN